MSGRKLPQALTLERFAGGKDGRSNAFKKKKQANKRKLFEKAQLKRQYAKLLRKDGMVAGADEAEATQVEQSARGEEEPGRPDPLSPKRKRQERKCGGDAKRRLDRNNIATPNCEKEEDRGKDGQRGQKHGSMSKRGRGGHRPDPFKAAKAAADKRRQEAEEKQRKRDLQVAEKEGRAKKRRKQHALLSQRTRAGQPVMKNTMRHLLEKIQSQT